MAILHEVGKNALYGHEVCPPAFLLSAITDHTVCRILMKCGVDILCKTFQANFFFRKNRLNGGHILLQGVKQFLTVIFTTPKIR